MKTEYVSIRYRMPLPANADDNRFQQLALPPPSDGREWVAVHTHCNEYGAITIIWGTTDPAPINPDRLSKL